MANMEHVIKVNGVVCGFVTDRQIQMYGKKKNLHKKCVVENHAITGQWKSVPRDSDPWKSEKKWNKSSK